ncbi:hypothetical protein FQA39_LY01501 [Lamprigera yunnana]|nr:hypothetical protein FQA39_LY01501 [Lamprigera yunnana]
MYTCLLSWDANHCHVDLEKELAIITEQAPEGEDARYGERLIQFASENLVTEVLIHPAISTLSQCMKNLLSSFTRHRHIIHAGYTFSANGSWILQDGTFSLTDFSEAFQEIDVQRVLRAYDNTISLDMHCSPEGDWARLPKEAFTKNCKVNINPDDVLTSGSPAIVNFLNYISPFLIPTDIEMLLESSDVVGNIRFSHPTLYVFPGGQGDAALFGINGFNMLVDGGFARKACFWDFVRHLDRLDAVLLSRLNNSNVNGISSVLRRKRHNTVYPQIGHFFCNIQEKKAILSPDGDKDKDPLLVNLFEEGQDIINNLRQLNLHPQPCYRDIEPINLYHKVGHGTLDMYILSPSRDSKEVKEFLQKWNANDQRLFTSSKNGKEFIFPTYNLVSICSLLVWQPANSSDNITRILFPGSSPQHKIFEGFDKLKQLECIRHPSCSAKTLTPTIIKSKLTKTEKILQEQKEIKTKPQIEIKSKIENRIVEENIKNGQTNGITVPEKIIKKVDSTESEKSGPQSLEGKKSEPTTEIINGKLSDDKISDKVKPKVRTEKVKPEMRVYKTIKAAEKKPKPQIEKKASPTTPKKVVEAKINGDAPIKSRTAVPAKTSPSSTPAKSAKDANNRKVVESKYKAAPKKDVSKSAEKKETKSERKPISRRPKGTSPIGKVPESPIKKISELHKIEIRKPKLEKECTTDSSTVSTPSADVETAMKKDLSKLTPEDLEQIKQRELAELKEEQEVVKEIEAVFRKSESKNEDDSDMRKIKSVSIDEKTDGNEEYLIIEKEEIDHDSLDEKDAKESETQKHMRDSEESEKRRKLSEVAEREDAEDEKEKQEKDKIIISTIKEDTVKIISKDISVVTPDDKVEESSGKKITDREGDDDNKDINVLESQPDEKYSTPIESGATTAPTLPEDERIPLDEIKEDIGIEEKYVKEETKEKETPFVQLPQKTTDSATKIPNIVGIKLDRQTPMRDIVKTPDEVADLPVHEVVDMENYDQYQASQVQMPKQDKIERDLSEEKLYEQREMEKAVEPLKVEIIEAIVDKLPELIKEEKEELKIATKVDEPAVEEKKELEEVESGIPETEEQVAKDVTRDFTPKHVEALEAIEEVKLDTKDTVPDKQDLTKDIDIEKGFKSEETDKPEHDKEDKIEVDECAYKKDKVLLESIPPHEFSVDKEPEVLSEIIEVDFKSQDELSKLDENNKDLTPKIKTDVDEIEEAKKDDHKDISEERKVEDIKKDGEDKTELSKEEATTDISLKEELKEKAEKEILEKTIDDKAKVGDIEKSEDKQDDKVDEELICKAEKQPLEMDTNISKGETEALPDEFQQESKLSDAVAKDEIKETEVMKEDNKTLMKEIEGEKVIKREIIKDTSEKEVIIESQQNAAEKVEDKKITTDDNKDVIDIVVEHHVEEIETKPISKAETIEAKEIEPKQDHVDTDKVHKAATGDEDITKEVVSKDDIHTDVVDEEVIEKTSATETTEEAVSKDTAEDKKVDLRPIHTDKDETADVHKDGIHKEETDEIPDTQITKEVDSKDSAKVEKEVEIKPVHMDKVETDDVQKDIIEKTPDTQITDDVIIKDAQGDKKEVELKPAHMDKNETDDSHKGAVDKEKISDTEITEEVIAKDAPEDEKEVELKLAHMDKVETDDVHKDVIERVSDTQITKEVVSEDAPKGEKEVEIKPVHMDKVETDDVHKDAIAKETIETTSDTQVTEEVITKEAQGAEKEVELKPAHMHKDKADDLHKDTEDNEIIEKISDTEITEKMIAKDAPEDENEVELKPAHMDKDEADDVHKNAEDKETIEKISDTQITEEVIAKDAPKDKKEVELEPAHMEKDKTDDVQEDAINEKVIEKISDIQIKNELVAKHSQEDENVELRLIHADKDKTDDIHEGAVEEEVIEKKFDTQLTEAKVAEDAPEDEKEVKRKPAHVDKGKTDDVDKYAIDEKVLEKISDIQITQDIVSESVSVDEKKIQSEPIDEEQTDEMPKVATDATVIKKVTVEQITKEVVSNDGSDVEKKVETKATHIEQDEVSKNAIDETVSAKVTEKQITKEEISKDVSDEEKEVEPIQVHVDEPKSDKVSKDAIDETAIEKLTDTQVTKEAVPTDVSEKEIEPQSVHVDAEKVDEDAVDEKMAVKQTNEVISEDTSEEKVKLIKEKPDVTGRVESRRVSKDELPKETEVDKNLEQNKIEKGKDENLIKEKEKVVEKDEQVHLEEVEDKMKSMEDQINIIEKETKESIEKIEDLSEKEKVIVQLKSDHTEETKDKVLLEDADKDISKESETSESEPTVETNKDEQQKLGTLETTQDTKLPKTEIYIEEGDFKERKTIHDSSEDTKNDILKDIVIREDKDEEREVAVVKPTSVLDDSTKDTKKEEIQKETKEVMKQDIAKGHDYVEINNEIIKDKVKKDDSNIKTVSRTIEVERVSVEKSVERILKKDDKEVAKETEDEKEKDTTEDEKEDVVEKELKVEFEEQDLFKEIKGDLETLKSDIIDRFEEKDIESVVVGVIDDAKKMIESVSKAKRTDLVEKDEVEKCEIYSLETELQKSEQAENEKDVKVDVIQKSEVSVLRSETKIETVKGETKTEEKKEEISMQYTREYAEGDSKIEKSESPVSDKSSVLIDDETEHVISKDQVEKETKIEVQKTEEEDMPKEEPKPIDKISVKFVDKVDEAKENVEVTRGPVTIEHKDVEEPITVSQSTFLSDSAKGKDEFITDDKTSIKSFRDDSLEISKIEQKLQELKDSVSSESNKAESKLEIDLVDKMELGRKSPKEREQDVAKIVASVAEVLKSDAPLEEFEGKLSLGSFNAYPQYSTELRETHITTLESPIHDIVVESILMDPIEEEKLDPVSLLINEERKIADVHSDSSCVKPDGGTRVSSLLKDSTELIEATSKMISDIKQSAKTDTADPLTSAKFEQPESQTKTIETIDKHEFKDIDVSGDTLKEVGLKDTDNDVEIKGKSNKEELPHLIASNVIKDKETAVDDTKDATVATKSKSKEMEAVERYLEGHLDETKRGADEDLNQIQKLSTTELKDHAGDDVQKSSSDLTEKLVLEKETKTDVADTLLPTDDNKDAAKQPSSDTFTKSVLEKESILHENVAQKIDEEKVKSDLSAGTEVDRNKDSTSTKIEISTVSDDLLSELDSMSSKSTTEETVKEKSEYTDISNEMESSIVSIEIKTLVDKVSKPTDQTDIEKDLVEKISEVIDGGSGPILEKETSIFLDKSTLEKTEKEIVHLVSSETEKKDSVDERTTEKSSKELTELSHVLRDQSIPGYDSTKLLLESKNIEKDTGEGEKLEETLAAQLISIKSAEKDEKPIVEPITSSETQPKRSDDLDTSIKLTAIETTSLDLKITPESIIKEDEEKDKPQKSLNGKTEIKTTFSVPSEEPTSIIKTSVPIEQKTLSGISTGRSSPETVESTKDLLDTKISPSLSRRSTPEIVVNDFVVSDRLFPEKDIYETEEKSSVPEIKDKVGDIPEHISQKALEPEISSVETNIDLNVNTQSLSNLDKLSDTKTTDDPSSIVPVPEISSVSLTQETAELKEHALGSKAGPSGISEIEVDKAKELEISRQSTPEITKDINVKDTEELAVGTITPPTAPVSPIVKDKFSIEHERQVKSVEITTPKSSDIRSSTPASDDCDISSGQVSRVLTTEDDDEKQVYSDDDEIPGSPLSATSQIAHSLSSQYDFDDSVRGITVIDPMSTSLYGALPDNPIDLTKDLQTESSEKEIKQEGRKDLSTSSSSRSHLYELSTAKYSSIPLLVSEEDPKPSILTQTDIMTASFIGSELPTDTREDPLASWSKPLGLPSPAPINDNKGTPKKERKIPSNVVAKNKLNEDKKNLDSKFDKKGKKINPIYVDLTYVPHHGNSNYSYVDFFKRIRARYYVFSGIEPSKEVYNALLEAKQTWDDKDLGKGIKIISSGFL